MTGRRAEVAEVRRRLRSPDRLVTVTGGGGVGKSWLARTVAAELDRLYRDGVACLDLTDLADDRLLEVVVAQALGVPLAEGGTLAEALPGAADRQTLLVLDGCDHLLGPCAGLVVSVLAACPDVDVLATGRQPLRVTGESVLALEPLACPDIDELPAHDRLTDYDAIALFVERATAVVPSFRLTEENSEVVARLCAAVNGVPLALELAAARLSVLSPHAILERLDDRYRLLTKGAPDAPAHQQSLLASVELSYDLCSPEEQVLWARMSVFTGSFDLDAAEAVCSGEGLDEADILDLVDSLLERSILVRADVDDTQVRYRMLESLREYGAQRLDDRERDHWRSRHLAWFSALAAQAAGEWFGPGQLRWRRTLDAELPNLRAAVDHAVGRPDTAATAVHAIADLAPFWMVSGRMGEARRLLARGIRAVDSSSGARVRGLHAAVELACLQGDLPEARRLFDEASREMTPAEEVGGPRGRAQRLRATALLAVREGRTGDAESLLVETLAAGSVDAAGAAVAWLLLGLSRGAAGNLTGAAEAHGRCLSLTLRAGEKQLRSYSLSLIATAALAMGDGGAVERHGREALKLAVELGDRATTALLLEVLAGAAAPTDPQRGATLVGAAQALRHHGEAGIAGPFGASLGTEDVVGALRSALGEHRFDACVQDGLALPPDLATALALGEATPTRTPGAAAESAGESPLTPREDEVAELVARGITNREIAEALGISHRTAQGHVENILRKLGLTSRTQLATWVVERSGSGPGSGPVSGPARG